MPEVEQHEPGLALFAENDGLEFYERIAREVCAHLTPGGRLYVEIGATQGEPVSKLFEKCGLSEVRVTKDLIDLRGNTVENLEKPIYLDYGATSPMWPEAVTAMLPVCARGDQP